MTAIHLRDSHPGGVSIAEVATMEILTTLLLWLNVASPEPPVRLDDLVAFPSRDTIRVEFGRAWDHRRDVWDAITFHTPAHGPGMRHYQDVITAMEWTYQVWDALDDASNPYWGAEQRLCRLHELRRLLGWRAYHHGAMPMIPGR